MSPNQHRGHPVGTPVDT